MSVRRNIRRTARNTAATARAVQQQTAFQARVAWNEHHFRYDSDPTYRVWVDDEDRRRRLAAAEVRERQREARQQILRLVTFGLYRGRSVTATRTPAPQLEGPVPCSRGCGTYLYPEDTYCLTCGAAR